MVLDILGHMRYVHELRDHGDVIIAVPDVLDVVQPCVVVVDPCLCCLVYGNRRDFMRLTNTEYLNMRLLIRFFEVRSSQYTSSKVYLQYRVVSNSSYTVIPQPLSYMNDS